MEKEIIIQTQSIGNAAIPTDENGRVWVYYGESDSIKKEDARRYYVSAVDIIKGRVGKERLQGKVRYSWNISNWTKRYSSNSC